MCENIDRIIDCEQEICSRLIEFLDKIVIIEINSVVDTVVCFERFGYVDTCTYYFLYDQMDENVNLKIHKKDIKYIEFGYEHIRIQLNNNKYQCELIIWLDKF